MKKYVIFTDTCSDVMQDMQEKYDIKLIPMHYIYDNTDYLADLNRTEEEWHEFYDLIRNGKVIKTAQVTQSQFEEAFEKAILEGYDILYIACASGLSATVDSSYMARDVMLEKYPDAKIVCIDSLNSAMGEGMLCMVAADMRAEGKTIEEVAAWLEEHKLEVHQEVTVDKLVYFKRAGRVSATSAFFGGLLNIKPIVISNVKGENQAIEKVKGRQASIKRLVERMKADYREVPYQRVHIVHADCLEDAKFLEKEVVAAFPQWEGKIVVSGIGPTVGATAGPGTVGVFFFGDKVTITSDAE